MEKKTIDELIEEDVERESRVEMKPIPPSQLSRIERMLKWLLVDALDRRRYFYSLDGNTYHYSRFREALPDISDIIGKSGK